MSLQVGGVELAPGPDVLRGLAGHDARAAQAVEVFHSGARLAPQHAANDLAERGVASEQNEYAPQVVAERPLVAVGRGLELRQPRVAGRHLVQAPPHKIRVAAQKAEESPQLLVALQRRAVAAIKLSHLLRAEVLQLQA